MWFKPFVKFYVNPVKGADLGEIVRILETAGVSARVWKHSSDSGIPDYLQFAICDAKRKVYENLFSAKVEYKEGMWVEVEPAKIPESLKGKVKSIDIEGYGSLLA